LALDTDSLEQALDWVDRFRSHVNLFKVGSQLFTAVGPKAVEKVKERGSEVFLDLKFHDIPNTVTKSVSAATALGVRFANVHALGGSVMIQQAVQAAHEEANRLGVTPPSILAVTILTSLAPMDLSRMGMHESVTSYVERLASMAITAGASGLIISPWEIKAVRESLGDDVVLVTPGIRPEGTRKHDQKRVLGPQEALAAGADYLVMGRSLLEAPDPMGLIDALEK
jgi:orotidine-5'-phosphate decarboxylase